MFGRMIRTWLLVVAGVCVSACSGLSTCETTCAGCCTAEGVCRAGTEAAECGHLGASCEACGSTRSCTAGVCRTASTGGGSGAATGGGSATGGGGGALGGGGGTTADAGTDAGVHAAHPRLFVTSATFTGDLVTPGRSSDALTAADTLCNDAAADAGLGGAWQAMVAVGSARAFTRLEAGAPYLLVGTSTQVFKTATTLRALPEVPLNRDEFGAVVPASAVWSGTDRTGLNNGVTCNDWSREDGGVGSVGFTHDAGAWTGAVNQPCASQGRLYCFEF